MNLLQIDVPGYIVYIFFGVILIVVGIFITRWVFRIDAIIDYMDKQTKLMTKIALHNNVPKEEIEKELDIKI
jgi:hypothetical protein